MKILITGSKGQLGVELRRQLTEENDEHYVLSNDVAELDITDSKQVTDFITGTKPEIIINCAAYTNVDKCEIDEELAFRVNAIGPQILAAAALEIGAKILHISTDYVFDGTGKQPWREYDQINPQNVYGKSKAFGEKLVRECNPRHYILRSAWLYGAGNNFVNTMLRLATEKKEINVVNDQYGTPTSTKELAKCIITIMKTNNYGTFHATCEGACSWWEFAEKIFQIKNMNIKVKPITSDMLERTAKRPNFSVLDNFRLKLLGLNSFKHWEVSLKEYLEGEL